MANLTITSASFASLANALITSLDHRFNPQPASAYVPSPTCFEPVEVKHGRKFKGFGYITDSWRKGNGGFHGSGVRPYKEIEVCKVWIPDTDKADEFNTYSRDEAVPVETIGRDRFLGDFLKYVNGVLVRAEARCGSDLRWRTNYVKKVLSVSTENAQALIRESAKQIPVDIVPDLWYNPIRSRKGTHHGHY